MAVIIADLKKRVKFEENGPQQDDAGNWSDSYVEFLEAWGSLKKITGFRSFTGFQPQLIGKWELIVYKQAALENKAYKSMRVVAGNRFFTVESIDWFEDDTTAFMRLILKDQNDK